MMFDRFAHHVGMRDRAHDFGAYLRVQLDLIKLVIIERAWLVQYPLGDEDLPHVMYASGVYQVGGLLRRKPQCPRDDFAVAGNKIAVPRSLQLAGFGCTAQGFNGFLQNRHIAILVSTAQLV